VLVGRIRPDRAGKNSLVLFLACDNLVKGAALNAIQIAELLLKSRTSSDTIRVSDTLGV
jgi:aspartate-semialdehyde dehydrogenase